VRNVKLHARRAKKSSLRSDEIESCAFDEIKSARRHSDFIRVSGFHQPKG
jgi:hypothetical protein